MNEKISKHDDEIEFMDILLVIWRWKFFILGVVTSVTISAIIYVFSVPEIYKCSIIIKPSVIEKKGSSEKDTIVSSTEIKAVIGSKLLNDQMIDSLKLHRKDLYKSGLSFNAKTDKNTDNITVNYYCDEPDQGIAILDSLVVALNEYFQPKINDYIEKENLNISVVDIQIKNYINQLRRVEADKADQINYILKEREYFENEKAKSEKVLVKIIERIKSIEKQKKRIEKKYDALVEHSKANLKTTEVLLFSNNTIIFELKLDRLQEEEYNLQMRLLEEKNRINNNFIQFRELSGKSRNVQENYLIDKENIELSINMLENNKILQQSDTQKNKLAVEAINPPVSLSKPVRPKKKLIIVLSFVSSLFMSIFCAFIFEYFRNYNKRTSTNN